MIMDTSFAYINVAHYYNSVVLTGVNDSQQKKKKGGKEQKAKRKGNQFKTTTLVWIFCTPASLVSLEILEVRVV